MEIQLPHSHPTDTLQVQAAVTPNLSNRTGNLSFFVKKLDYPSSAFFHAIEQEVPKAYLKPRGHHGMNDHCTAQYSSNLDPGRA